MNLQRAASWFSKVSVDGWNGSTWDLEIDQVTFLPHDRFISEREFGNKRRYVLCNPEIKGISQYKLIRLAPTQQTYMVGYVNYDALEETYSKLHLLHVAPLTAEVYAFTKTQAASGMGMTATKTLLETSACDVERITFQNSKIMNQVRFSECVVILPSTSIADTEHEIKVGDELFDIQESYQSAGFKYCRSIAKRAT